MTPDIQGMEKLNRKMQKGYKLLDEGRLFEAIHVWREAWDDIKYLMTQHGIIDIDSFDGVFVGTQSVYNWAGDFETELGNAAVEDKAYCQQRIDFCREYLERYKDPSELNASITFGWEPLEFYQKWMGAETLDNEARALKGPALMSMVPQSELAPELLELVIPKLRETAYVELLKRHYYQFKAALRGERIDVPKAGAFHDNEIEDVRTLTQDDAARFYKIFFNLIDYTNNKYRVVPKLKNISQTKNVDPNSITPIRDKLWESDDLITEVVNENPFGFNERDLALIASWKKRIADNFLIYKHLKKYTVFMGKGGLYGVVGIVSPIEELFPSYVLPLYAQAVLLPFEGRIIYDSLIGTYNIAYGSGMLRGFKEDYRKLKNGTGIITRL